MAGSFDERAATWDDDPGKVEMAEVVGRAVRARVPVNPTTRLLEYGAGTGLATQALAAHVGPVTLADPSAGMREVMASKVAGGALPSDARIWDLDLVRDDVPEERFDLVLVVMALHHIGDADRALRGFRALLADGGHLCIVDLEEDDGSFHRHSPDFDGHDGFAQPQLDALLREAGFDPVSRETIYDLAKDEGTFPVFLATAVPVTSRRG